MNSEKIPDEPLDEIRRLVRIGELDEPITATPRRWLARTVRESTLRVLSAAFEPVAVEAAWPS